MADLQRLLDRIAELEVRVAKLSLIAHQALSSVATLSHINQEK